jgi:hypothetical protein
MIMNRASLNAYKQITRAEAKLSHANKSLEETCEKLSKLISHEHYLVSAVAIQDINALLDFARTEESTWFNTESTDRCLNDKLMYISNHNDLYPTAIRPSEKELHLLIKPSTYAPFPKILTPEFQKFLKSMSPHIFERLSEANKNFLDKNYHIKRPQIKSYVSNNSDKFSSTFQDIGVMKGITSFLNPREIENLKAASKSIAPKIENNQHHLTAKIKEINGIKYTALLHSTKESVLYTMAKSKELFVESETIEVLLVKLVKSIPRQEEGIVKYMGLTGLVEVDDVREQWDVMRSIKTQTLHPEKVLFTQNNYYDDYNAPIFRENNVFEKITLNKHT